MVFCVCVQCRYIQSCQPSLSTTAAEFSVADAVRLKGLSFFFPSLFPSQLVLVHFHLWFKLCTACVCNCILWHGRTVLLCHLDALPWKIKISVLGSCAKSCSIQCAFQIHHFILVVTLENYCCKVWLLLVLLMRKSFYMVFFLFFLFLRCLAWRWFWKFDTLQESKDSQVQRRATKTGTMAGMLTENAIVALNNGDVDLRPILQVSVSIRAIYKVLFMQLMVTSFLFVL